jgi:plastocyanin
MNTRKQVLIMSGLLLVMLIVIGVYAAWYPSRADSSEESFVEATEERGAILFSRNCRLCHGDVAEGGALGGRLAAAPALHRPDLQGFDDSKGKLTAEVTLTATSIQMDDPSGIKPQDMILVDEERMKVTSIDGQNLEVERAQENTKAAGHFTGGTVYVFSEDSLNEKIDLITNTITCGRVGTPMPAWSKEQNGPLSDEQIRQLMVLITNGRWDLVEEENNVEDLIAAHLTGPVSADATEISVTDATRFNAGDAIRLDDERIRVTALPEGLPAGALNIPGTLTVERGVDNSIAADHPQDTTIYKFPEVAEPAINKASCGQTAQAPAPQGTPGTIDDFSGGETVEVTAQNVAFDQKEITIPAGGDVRIRLTNKDAGTDHNIAFYNSESDTTPVSDGSVGVIFPGSAEGVVDDTVFAVPDPGTYYFRCDVHPTIMFGTFTVQ